MVIGIDEVGRGAWAGPLTVAAVGLGGYEIEGLTDSKLLSKKRREKLSHEIKQVAPLIGIGWVSARDIDHIGLSAALKLAARRAVSQLDLSRVDQIIIDGTIDLLAGASRSQNASGVLPEISLMKKADLLVPSVSAASIVAKVARDAYMAQCDNVFAGYGFRGHVGYGAAAHREAIEKLGVLPIHRKSFAPIRDMVEPGTSINSQLQKNTYEDNPESSIGDSSNSSTTIGRRAEDAAARYLESRGYEIVERNWKTRWCEIDIIVMCKKVIYFVEVKYRKSARQGGGIAAITPKKLNQMKFAAKLWLHTTGDYDARLSVIEIAGEEFEVTRFLENIT